VFFIFVIITVEISIVLVYFQLCAEVPSRHPRSSLQDYHWQWRSFFTGGSISIYVLLYSLYHYAHRLTNAGPVALVLFIGYMVIVAYLLFILAGFVAFMASFMFIRKIYGSIKLD
jgi:transmembrane 9 superfamily member 2/4